MFVLYRVQHFDRWIVSAILVTLVPPCGCMSLLCLALAHRYRQNCAEETAITIYLEWISYSAVAVAFFVLLAANIYAGQQYRGRLLLYLTSVNCSAVVRNHTLESSIEGSFLPQSPRSIDDRLIKQRFVMNGDVSVLQSPVDVELSVIRRNMNVLPVPVASRYTDSSLTSNKP